MFRLFPLWSWNNSVEPFLPYDLACLLLGRWGAWEIVYVLACLTSLIFSLSLLRIKCSLLCCPISWPDGFMSHVPNIVYKMKCQENKAYKSLEIMFCHCLKKVNGFVLSNIICSQYWYILRSNLEKYLFFQWQPTSQCTLASIESNTFPKRWNIFIQKSKRWGMLHLGFHWQDNHQHPNLSYLLPVWNSDFPLIKVVQQWAYPVYVYYPTLHVVWMIHLLCRRRRDVGLLTWA